MGVVGETMELQALKTEVLADGKVDADEVAKLNTIIFADGRVDRAEADVLFEINDKVSGAENDAGWDELFIKGVSEHVLSDEKSPGEIDEGEADYLISKVMSDGTVDELEKKLLTNIKAKATKVHEKLQAKFTELGI